MGPPKEGRPGGKTSTRTAHSQLAKATASVIHYPRLRAAVEAVA